MLPFHATNKKKAYSSHGFLLVAAGAIRKKARVRIFFCKNYLCNFNGFFISSAFFYIPHILYIRQQPLKKLVLNI